MQGVFEEKKSKPTKAEPQAFEDALNRYRQLQKGVELGLYSVHAPDIAEARKAMVAAYRPEFLDAL